MKQISRKADFICGDNRTATKFTIHTSAAVAEAERDMIATRMREDIAAAMRAGKSGSAIRPRPQQSRITTELKQSEYA